VADIQVNTLLDWAMLCLTTAVTGNPNPPENFCRRLDLQVAHDADWYTDLCCEGLAYVSFGDVFPAWSEFPEPDVVRQANYGSCSPPAWAVQIRMGMIRCVPVQHHNGMPSCDDWTQASRQQADDSQALRAATCCFRQRIVADSDAPGIFWGMSAVIGNQGQIQLQGGCVERNVTVTVQIPNCDCFTVS
jgi:hypothetical protein